MTFSPGQLDFSVSPEHTLNLQIALMETPGKEGEIFHPRVCKELRSTVWAYGMHGRVKNAILIRLEKDAGTPNLKQYLLRQEAQKRI